MTVMGLVIPPAQISVQILSTLFLMAPVIITSVLDFKVNGYIILNFPSTFNAGLPNQRATNGTLLPIGKAEKGPPDSPSSGPFVVLFTSNYSHSVFMAVSPMFFGVFSSHKPHILERLFCVSLFCVLFMYLEIRYLTIIFILTKGGFDQIIKSISQSGNELKI